MNDILLSSPIVKWGLLHPLFLKLISKCHIDKFKPELLYESLSKSNPVGKKLGPALL
jgi:hypothetical protein